MATNYPTSIDSFTNPTSGDTLDSPSHAAQHTNINDAMVAVQTKLGVGSGTIGTWTTWTPTAVNYSHTVNYAYYTRVNDLVVIEAYVTATANATATIFWGGIPVNISPATAHTMYAHCLTYDDSAGEWHKAVYVENSGTSAILFKGSVADKTGSNWGAVNPGSGGIDANDEIYLQMVYRGS